MPQASSFDGIIGRGTTNDDDDDDDEECENDDDDENDSSSIIPTIIVGILAILDRSTCAPHRPPLRPPLRPPSPSLSIHFPAQWKEGAGAKSKRPEKSTSR